MRRTLLMTLLILAAVRIPAAHAQTAVTDSSATADSVEVKAATEWLALIDHGEYGESWEQAAPFFRERVTKETWTEQIRGVVLSFGALQSRTFAMARHMTTMPGAPDGQYAVLEFSSRFAEKKEAVETVVLMNAGGVWKAAGYFIR